MVTHDQIESTLSTESFPQNGDLGCSVDCFAMTTQAQMDVSSFVARWWADAEGRRLPGEVGGVTVFVVSFEDGCSYFGYTRKNVFGRLTELMGGSFERGSDEFVREHGQRMAYLVYCVASDMERSCARRLRDQLVSQAPVGVYWADGATVTTSRCRLREGEPEAEVMSFAEWVKTRENEAGGEGTEITLP